MITTSNYIILKEKVMNDQTRGKLAAYNYEHKIEIAGQRKKTTATAIKTNRTTKKISYNRNSRHIPP